MEKQIVRNYQNLLNFDLAILISEFAARLQSPRYWVLLCQDSLGEHREGNLRSLCKKKQLESSSCNSVLYSSWLLQNCSLYSRRVNLSHTAPDTNEGQPFVLCPNCHGSWTVWSHLGYSQARAEKKRKTQSSYSTNTGNLVFCVPGALMSKTWCRTLEMSLRGALGQSRE